MTHLNNAPSPGHTDEPTLKRNLAALRENNVALADELFALDPRGDDPAFPGLKFEIRTARNGQTTMVAVTAEAEVAVHSTYDPQREAQDQVNGALGNDKRNYFVILGFGLGYAVERLAGEIGDDGKILVIEPHIGAFRLALASRDLSDLLTDKRIVITLGAGVDEALAAFLRRYSLSDCTGVGFLELASRTRLPSAGYFANFLERLKGVLVTTGGNLQTLMLMAWQYQRNTFTSMGKIIDHPPVRTLFGAFEKKPAIIVSAGPSLQKNIDQLGELKERCVLVAVDTSLRPLLQAGVEPHLVCTGDPQEANWRHLKGAQTKEARLVAEPMTYPLSLDYFDGRLFIASYNDKVMKWLARFMPDVGHVLCWGSVATMAFDLARKMGCDPIIFVGQDLSFPGGRTYVKGTYFEDEEKMDLSVEAYERIHTTYSMTDIYGDPVKTNRQMFAYKEWFRSEFARTPVTVINATEGGILKDNCRVMPLKEAADSFLVERFDAMSVIRERGAHFEGYDLASLHQAMLDDVSSVKRCIEICDKGTARIREVVQAIEKMERLSQVWCAEIIAELDSLRFQMMKEPSMKEFLETANQTGVLNFHRAYRAVNGKPFSRIVFREALDLFTNLFMSTGRTARGVLPFHLLGLKILAGRSNTGSDSKEELCLTKT